MSADNGIYILPLIDGFYVAHRQAIDNLWYNRDYGAVKEYNPEVVVDYFSDAKRFDTKDEAQDYAYNLAKDYDILEYGVCMLDAQPHSMAEYIQIVTNDCESKLEMKEVATLPNSCSLYRKDNGVGGHCYYSDEIGGGVNVWDTSLVAESTLIAAILDQHKLRYQEAAKT